MAENIIVALMVALAALYALYRYAPKWLVRKSVAWLAHGAASFGMQTLAKIMAQNWTVESPSGKSCGSGCGSCGACGSGVVAGAGVGVDVDGSFESTVPANDPKKYSVIKIHQREANQSVG